MPNVRPAGAAALAALPAFAAGAYLALAYPPNHDISWLMYAAGRWLDGARLYRDVVEVNPPLVVWLSALPELAARVSGAWPATVFRAFVLGLAALSLLLVLRVLRPRLGSIGAGAACLLASLLAYAFTALPRYEFGQREHLAVLLALPYLVLAGERLAAGADAAAAPSRAGSIALGVMGGAGFALKPFFLLAWLLPEAYLLRQRRGAALRRPELLALLATFAAYLLATLLLAPDYLPFLELTGSAYAGFVSNPLGALVRQRAFGYAVLALALWLLARRASPLRAHGDMLALALLGFTIGVLAQRKGWFYHWIPTATLTLGLFALTAERGLALLRSRVLRARRWEAAVAVGAVVVSLALVLPGARDVTARREAMKARAYRLPELLEVVRRHGRGGPIAALSTNPHAGFPLIDYARVPWALRLNALWLLPGVYPPNPVGRPFPYRAPADMPRAERYQFEAVLADLLRERPTVLIVDRIAPGYVLNGFNYLAYFGQDPRFLQLLSAYREFPPVERYRILVRAR